MTPAEPTIPAVRAPMQHNLRCWPVPFGEMLAGRKVAEYRLNDRDFRTGDTLLIREWCPTDEVYTHRELTRRITHVLAEGYGLPRGYAMLSLATPRTPKPTGDMREQVARVVSDAVRHRLERIAGSGLEPGSNRNMMLKPADAQAILAALPPARDAERERLREQVETLTQALAEAVVIVAKCSPGGVKGLRTALSAFDGKEGVS